MSQSISLHKKRISVTGGARGLGNAFASSLVEAGAQVAIADILVEEGNDAAKSIGAQFFDLDISDPARVSSCIEEVIKRLGGIDGLVNNAAIATGIGGPGMTDIEVEVWDKVMDVNVRGTWLVSKASVPHLAKCGNGKILNLASDTALWGATNLMHYVASRGAVVAVTRSMANELGKKGISVNCIAPGLTEVEATEYVPEERKQLYRENRSLKRTQMPSDITGSVLFFMSDASDFITGQCLPVNGGFVMN